MATSGSRGPNRDDSASADRGPSSAALDAREAPLPAALASPSRARSIPSTPGRVRAPSPDARPARASDVETLVEGEYPEGPLWDPEVERLVFVEYARHAVARFDPATGAKETLWRSPGVGPSSVTLSPRPGAARYLVAGYDAHALIALDRDGRELARVERDQNGDRLEWLNDFAHDGRGGLYFTGSGMFELGAPSAGKVYFWGPKEARPRLVADGIRYSNGLAVTPRGDTLLVAEMFADRLLAFPIDRASGALGPRRVFADLAHLAPDTNTRDPFPLSGPDGLKIDPRDGRVYVAHHGTGRLLMLSSSGVLERSVSLPHRFTTNVALAPDGERLWVTAEGRAEAPYRGALLELAKPRV